MAHGLWKMCNLIGLPPQEFKSADSIAYIAWSGKLPKMDARRLTVSDGLIDYSTQHKDDSQYVI